MEKVVYLLGAGFSAPLGLPVMSNFLTKSKDMFTSDSQKFYYFQGIFNTIDEMHKSNSFYHTDLANIEEILSILEMKRFLGQAELDIDFNQFIAAVIMHFTPEIIGFTGQYPSKWYKVLFGDDTQWNKYGCFLGNLINLQLRKNENSISAAHFSEGGACYHVVTLNYDLVLENAWHFIKKLTKRVHVQDYPMKGLEIAKLHGSAEIPKTIISPTWNKISPNFPEEAWKNACKWLSEANHIRIIGYSLPTADSYIKYLLKAAVLNSFNLKTIDVICLDPSGDVKKRYDDFVRHGQSYKFCNMGIEDYLKKNIELHVFEFEGRPRQDMDFINYQYLEYFHENLMRSY